MLILMAAIGSLMLCHNQVFYQQPEVTIIIHITLVPGSLHVVTFFLDSLCKRDMKENNEVQLHRSVAV